MPIPLIALHSRAISQRSHAVRAAPHADPRLRECFKFADDVVACECRAGLADREIREP